jgi:hypothetical protein
MWLVLGATLSAVAGCASGGRMTRSGHACPSGFVEYCEDSNYEYRCTCVDRAAIDSVLREWQTP